MQFRKVREVCHINDSEGVFPLSAANQKRHGLPLLKYDVARVTVRRACAVMLQRVDFRHSIERNRGGGHEPHDD